MKPTEYLYGRYESERLFDDPEEFFNDEYQDSCAADVDEYLNDLQYPVVLHEFRRMNVGEYSAENRSADMLQNTIEDLDADYGGEEATEPTDAMKAAAFTFWTVMLAEYKVYMCEPTGQTVEFSRDEIEKMIMDGGAK